MKQGTPYLASWSSLPDDVLLKKNMKTILYQRSIIVEEVLQVLSEEKFR
jgi:hypothetical protein